MPSWLSPSSPSTRWGLGEGELHLGIDLHQHGTVGGEVRLVVAKVSSKYQAEAGSQSGQTHHRPFNH